MHPIVAVVVIAVGVIGGAAVLRRAPPRPAIYQRKLVQRALPPARRAKIERAYARYGGRLVFIARFVAGMRSGTFALAGVHGMSAKRFLFWDSIAACISIPLVMGLGYLGASHLDEISAGLAAARMWLLAGFVVVVLALVAWHFYGRRSRYQLLGS